MTRSLAPADKFSHLTVRLREPNVSGTHDEVCLGYANERFGTVSSADN